MSPRTVALGFGVEDIDFFLSHLLPSSDAFAFVSGAEKIRLRLITTRLWVARQQLVHQIERDEDAGRTEPVDTAAGSG